MMLDSPSLLNEVRAIESELISVRRTLHKIPELGDKLPKTKAVVCAYLKNLGIPYREMDDGDGVIAEIVGKRNGKTIAFRADMDGLKIEEETEVPFRSEIPGQMHACAHDVHTAILLLTAKLLLRYKENLFGRVRLLFQTGEESSTGAKKMIACGAIEGVSNVFAIHAGNLAGDTLSAGDFAILGGYVSAGKNRLTITVKGKGTHSAFPEKGNNSLLIAAKIVLAINEITKNELPLDTAAVLATTAIHGGADQNTIPEKTTILGSIRAQDPAVREFLTKRVEEICETVTKEAGATYAIDVIRSSQSIWNDEKTASTVADAVSKVLGLDCVKRNLPKPLMASDDFVYFSKALPSVYFTLHTNNPDKGITEANHNPRFDVDESVLYKGVAAYLAIALRFLNEQ